MTDQKRSEIPPPGQSELEYIAAMSRASVVAAYSEWSGLSKAEKLCLENSLPQNPRVLDLGCGTGRMAEALSERYVYYLGIDRSVEMIDAARQRFPHLDFCVGDIVVHDFENSPVNTVLLMHNVLDGLFPIERRLAVLHRSMNLLPKNGALICSSHLLKQSSQSGYFEEEYHGSRVFNYRSTMSKFVNEIENIGFIVRVACRDYRDDVADWCYIAAIKEK